MRVLSADRAGGVDAQQTPAGCRARRPARWRRCRRPARPAARAAPAPGRSAGSTAVSASASSPPITSAATATPIAWTASPPSRSTVRPPSALSTAYSLTRSSVSSTKNSATTMKVTTNVHTDDALERRGLLGDDRQRGDHVVGRAGDDVGVQLTDRGDQVVRRRALRRHQHQQLVTAGGQRRRRCSLGHQPAPPVQRQPHGRGALGRVVHEPLGGDLTVRSGPAAGGRPRRPRPARSGGHRRSPHRCPAARATDRPQARSRTRRRRPPRHRPSRW